MSFLETVEATDASTMSSLKGLARKGTELLISLLDKPWVADGIEDVESEAIDWIGNFSDAEVALSVVALGWMEEGIEELEVKAIQELYYISNDDAALALAVVDLEWVQDSIEEIEAEAIDWFSNFGDVEVTFSVIALDWVQEGVDSQEVMAIEELSFLSRKNESQAYHVVGMPFLDTLEPSDLAALESLVDLVWFRQADYQRIISHPTLSDGITDDWAKVVATLYGVSDTNPALIDTLLDPDQVTLEERTIDLPLAGETLLAIIRTAPGSEQSMDLLEHSTRSIEAYMAVPLPTNYVALLYENAVSGDSAGTNFGTHVTALPKYDVDDDSNAAEFAGSLIAHEVAHYYWSGNRGWVDEGIADLMGSLSENARAGLPIEVTNNPCGYVRTIAELETLEPEVGDSTYSCNYALGERLFVDLYRNLDEDDFRTGLWELYLLSQVEDENETDEDVLTGIDHVRTAFNDAEDVEDSLVDVVTARWYDGTEPYSTTEESTGLPNPLLSTINGRIHTAYLSATQKGTPLTTISADAVDDYLWLLLRWDYTVGSNTEVPIELMHYYEDGFEFKRRSVSFTADARHNGSLWSWWLRVGQSPTKPWATGNYRFQVYNEGRKLVELEYEVTP